VAGNRALDNPEYDQWLSENKKERELRDRTTQRRQANKGYEGWHFGIDQTPVYCRDKSEFRKALHQRGLMMREDVKRDLH